MWNSHGQTTKRLPSTDLFDTIQPKILSLLNTKENKAKLNVSTLHQRPAEISEIGGSWLVARMRARVLAEKPSTIELERI